jgi:hypothetical protein
MYKDCGQGIKDFVSRKGGLEYVADFVEELRVNVKLSQPRPLTTSVAHVRTLRNCKGDSWL